MVDIIKMISKYNHSARNDIQYIVIHDTGSYKDSAWANANYFNSGNVGASAHYFVDESLTYQVVEDCEGAWHCGDRYAGIVSNNPDCTCHNSIGIEMCNSGGYIANETINNTLELVKMLMNKYGININHVIRHFDVSGKICPQRFSDNNWSKWWDFKSRLLGGKYTPSQPSLLQKASTFLGNRCKELQEKLISCGYNCGGYGADGSFGQGTLDSIVQFQKNNGLTADGLAGNATFSKLDEVIANKNKPKGKYLVTNYLPTNSDGYVDIEYYVHKYFEGIKVWLKTGEKGCWLESSYIYDAEVLDKTANALNNDKLYYGVYE